MKSFQESKSTGQKYFQMGGKQLKIKRHGRRLRNDLTKANIQAVRDLTENDRRLTESKITLRWISTMTTELRKPQRGSKVGYAHPGPKSEEQERKALPET